MKNYDLSVIITARNEEFLSRTVEGVLNNSRGSTEVIVVLDGAWADPPLVSDPRLTVIYHNEPAGQRASINEAIRMSKAKYIMKLDAHCIMDEGFDVKLMADCEPNWVVVPRLYNLHVFDWKCNKCGNRWYQGPEPKQCYRGEHDPNPKCDNTTDFEKVMVWEPRWNRKTDFMRFDSELHFQYWGDLGKRPESEPDIADTMSLLGACFFMHRDWYWAIDGSDEATGSWGQQGTEISCKTWLAGGRLVVNKKTWYSHLFRTQDGFNFPYPSPDGEKARRYSQDFWRNGKWPKAIRPLSWLVEKFWPIPGWKDEDLIAIGGKVPGSEVQHTALGFQTPPEKGIIYYTDNKLNLKIAHAVQKQLLKIKLPIVSASLKPMSFGKNINLGLERGYLTMAKQILSALEASTAKYIFFCEHDVLYHPSHFEFTPPRDDVYYYNTNVWKVRSSDGHALHYDCQQLSGLCANREFLINHFRKRLPIMEEKSSLLNEHDFAYFVRRMGFEPGTHNRPERIDDFKAESWISELPNFDIRHDANLTSTRWTPEEFVNKKHTVGWIEGDEVPGWGVTKDRFWDVLKEV